jgi:glycosyltransferase involved in cell wall biosynthesis
MEAVDRFVAPSRFAVEQLARLGVPGARLDEIANYVPEPAAAGSGDGGYAVLAARLSAEKGASVAIEAAARSGVPLVIAGDGPLEPELRAHVARTGAPVELLGHVPGSRVAELMTGASMALVPSLGPEVMPFAALEAMAAGVPVIASRTGSLPEIVGDERCVPRRDAEGLAAAMRRLWDDPELRRAEGAQLRARARERFSEERYTRDLLALYERVQAQA